MDACYADFKADIEYYRSLGADAESLARSEGLLNLFFITLNECDELSAELERKQANILRLQESLFGKSRTNNGEPSNAAIENESTAQSQPPSNTDSDSNNSASKQLRKTKKKPKKGHGRIGVDAYHAAEVVHCNHELLKPGDRCPQCKQSNLYLVDPKRRIVFEGQAPLVATCFELERLRCALCGTYFSATAAVATTNKYTASAKAILAIMHCQMGMTYYGLERLQANMGMPVPASTQSELIESMAGPCYAVLHHLIALAANAKLIGQDDSYVRILELMAENKNDPARKGMYISAFLAEGEHKIALFFAGRKHAGENFDDIMVHRDDSKDPINRMADALSANTKHKSKATNLKCNAHALRRFCSIASLYPEICEIILSLYGQVYDHEHHCKEQQLDDQARLKYHVKYSGPLMQQLVDFVIKQQKEVETNSPLGKEFNYLLNHWKELTQFLKIPGAPLDNNDTERILKIPIKYRNNSLLYVTSYSASYKMCITSVIATAQLNNVNAHHYLESVNEHESLVWQSPEQWMPWNYEQALLQATARQSSVIAA